jgi:hypothetical protein
VEVAAHLNNVFPSTVEVDGGEQTSPHGVCGFQGPRLGWSPTRLPWR